MKRNDRGPPLPAKLPLVDKKTEALIGPEPVIDPAAARAPARKVREE